MGIPVCLEGYKVFNVRTASRVLGISTKTLYGWISRGLVPQYSRLPSGGIGFTADQIQACIETIRPGEGVVDIEVMLKRPRRRYSKRRKIESEGRKK